MDLSKIPGRGGKSLEGLPEGVGKSSEVPPPPGWVAPWQEKKGPYEPDGFAGVALLAAGLFVLMSSGKMLAGIALWMWRVDASAADRMWTNAKGGGPTDEDLIVDLIMTALAVGLMLWALVVGAKPNSRSFAAAAGLLLSAVGGFSVLVQAWCSWWMLAGRAAVPMWPSMSQFALPAVLGTVGAVVLLRRCERLDARQRAPS